MGRLELRRDEKGGVSFVLEGTPVHPGQDVELLLEGGLWVPGRFEWTGEPQARPRLHLSCGGPWEAMSVEGDTLPIPPEVGFAIPAEALLRWPAGEDQ